MLYLRNGSPAPRAPGSAGAEHGPGRLEATSLCSRLVLEQFGLQGQLLVARVEDEEESAVLLFGIMAQTTDDEVDFAIAVVLPRSQAAGLPCNKVSIASAWPKGPWR